MRPYKYALVCEQLRIEDTRQNSAQLFSMMNSQTWFIVKLADGHCQIVSDEQVNIEPDAEAKERWGPFPSQAEAIARRVGLIRAGKCQPL